MCRTFEMNAIKPSVLSARQYIKKDLRPATPPWSGLRGVACVERPAWGADVRVVGQQWARPLNERVAPSVVGAHVSMKSRCPQPSQGDTLVDCLHQNRTTHPDKSSDRNGAYIPSVSSSTSGVCGSINLFSPAQSDSKTRA